MNVLKQKHAKLVEARSLGNFPPKCKNYEVIGLMLTRDDHEVLEDWLETYTNEFDKIFCLDGSTNCKESKEVLLKYDVEYSHDSDYDGLVKKDHPLRKVVFEKIKRYISQKEPCDYWIVLVHPDEFYQFFLNDVIKKAYQQDSTLIKLRNCHNAPQKSEIQQWKTKQSYKVFQHFLFPGWSENRIFKYSKEQYYDNKTHSLVIPQRLKKQNPFVGGPILHYKIMNFDLFKKDGTLTNSCWSSIRKHYPPGKTFRKIEDFELSKPSGNYKNNKILKI